MISILAWGLYLACSWTWCIALFLPVILVADVGLGAWPIFALCNVAGVAAMPFVIGTQRGSLVFVRRNLVACRIFSVVTILCQAWFMGWAASRLPWPAALLALVCIAPLVGAGRSDRRWQAAALAVTLVTLAAFINYLATSPNAPLAFTLANELTWHPIVLYTLPLLFAGFAFSPYLDLTFHHAMRANSHHRLAFAVAFPVLFGTMLLFSLSYRDNLASVMLQPAAVPGPVSLIPVLAVLMFQVGFTLVLHARQLPQGPWVLIKVAVPAFVAFLLAWMFGDYPMPTGQTLNEFAYRSSIGFYGVLAPCWVWTAAFIPSRPGRMQITLAATALLLAAIPMLLAPTWLPLYPAALAIMALTRFVPASTHGRAS